MTIADLAPRPYEPETDGIFDMPDPEYRKAPLVSQSMLKELRRSPAHMVAYVSAPPKKPTDAQIIGTITDHALLEPSIWKNSYVVRPAGLDFRTNEGKAWKKAHTGLLIVTEQEERDINGMIESVLSSDIARPIVLGGYNQPSVFCHHPSTAILRKGRFDKLLLDAAARPVVADLKTVENGSPRGFTLAVAKWDYHVQAAYYTDMLGDLIGERPFFPFITVEKEWPYVCTVYQLDPDSMEAGRKEYIKNLETYARCRDAMKWPAYSEQIETIRLPHWKLDPQSPIIPD